MDEVLMELQTRIDHLEREVKEGVRPRLHKLADATQMMQLASNRQEVLLTVFRDEMTHLQETTATRVQLDAGVQMMSQKLESFHNENKLTIKNITDQLDPMKKALYWAVALLFTAVGLALINLVLKGARG